MGRQRASKIIANGNPYKDIPLKVIPLIFKLPQNYVVEAARYLIMMMMGS